MTMPLHFEERPQWGPLATFVPNKKEPVYNWFYYKEGFAKGIVFTLIEHFGLKKGNWVLDPFCGSGTTLLACKQRGIDAIGIDALPLLVFVSQVKTRDYDLQALRETSADLFAKTFERVPSSFPPLFRKAFNRHSLDDIAFFRARINAIHEPAIRDFLMLGLITTAMKVSYVWKDGGVIKIRKHPVPPFRKFFKRAVSRMIKDSEKIGLQPCTIRVEKGDARQLVLEDECVDAVITSPPYLNQIDYTKVYEIENFFIGQSPPALRSYIGLYHAGGADQELPPQAQTYFADMARVIRELYRVCRDGARLGIVVGNAYFPGRIIDSDIELATIAEKTGFTVQKIVVLNKRFALENRTEKRGTLRESLILLEK